MRVVGLDPSLTSTGMAFATVDGAGVQLSTKTHKSNAKKDPTLADRGGRLHRLSEKIITDACQFQPELVLVEEPAHNQKSGHHHDRSGLWWLSVKGMIDSGLQVHEISITTLKKYATGSGAAAKEAVVIAATRRYPEVEFVTNDEADALILAAIGCRLLGAPIEPSLPKTNLDAMAVLKKLEIPSHAH